MPASPEKLWKASAIRVSSGSSAPRSKNRSIPAAAGVNTNSMRAGSSHVLPGVREAFGDEYERAGGRFRHVVREPEAQAPVEHVHELVLADMHVQRRAVTRLGAALPDRERAPCLLAARLVRRRSAGGVIDRAPLSGASADRA
jgi:hypothetical protein